MYYYYSKKVISNWSWGLWWNPVYDVTVIIRILIGELNYRRRFKTLSETKLRDFSKRN